jgi:hypothetical protein
MTDAVDPKPEHAALPADVVAEAQAILAEYGPEAAVKAAEIAPTKSTKAIVGAVVAGIVALCGPLLTELGDPHTDWSAPGAWLVPIITGIVGAGLVGGGVYIPTNRAK